MVEQRPLGAQHVAQWRSSGWRRSLFSAACMHEVLEQRVAGVVAQQHPLEAHAVARRATRLSHRGREGSSRTTPPRSRSPRARSRPPPRPPPSLRRRTRRPRRPPDRSPRRGSARRSPPRSRPVVPRSSSARPLRTLSTDIAPFFSTTASPRMRRDYLGQRSAACASPDSSPREGRASPGSAAPQRSRGGEVENGLGSRDGAHRGVRGQQLGVVKRATLKALGAVEPDERHRDRRERAEEGEVVRAAGAPLRSRLQARVGEQLARPAPRCPGRSRAPARRARA